MMNNLIAAIATISLLGTSAQPTDTQQPKQVVLSQRSFPLSDRYGNTFVNDVFKDNILLTLAYAQGQVKDAKDINWTEVEKPFHFAITLNPNQTFAFHDSILDNYKSTTVQTTHANFGLGQGFKSDGYLVGDGVCHLASLINWAAKDAQLKVYAPTNHDFAVIPDVPKEYGVAIYDSPDSPSSSAMQNLYVTNNKAFPVKIVFDYNGERLNTAFVEEIK